MLRYAKGDVIAFELLYTKHKLAVYRFFIRQPLPNVVAEELCHDVWLKIINNRENYHATALFTTYLFTIVRRIAIDYGHNRGVIFAKQHIDMEQASAVPSTDYLQCEQRSHSALANAIQQQIAALPFDQREVFLLKQESGFSIDDIANITGQKREKVKSCWRYALRKLRKGLGFYENE